uniref:Similar to amino acid transporter n=1 Tax=Bombyx mori TaxID=7091 RepID=G1UH32_BOMMO|nr:similar to amino acid transporter [Bombyx mori]
MSKNGLEEPSGSQPTPKETTPLITKGGENGNGGGKNGGLSVGQTRWIGVPIIILMCLVAAFSGKRLGDCWTILEERNPQLRSRKRNPYAIIADQTLGKTWSVVVSMAIIVTLFGASVVYLLMAAQIIEQLLLTLIPTLTICTWYLIVVGAMTPLIFFNSPKDLTFTGVIAFGSTVIACILYFIEMMNEVRPFVFRWGVHGFTDFFLAFGTIMFAFGGASTFPTIQNDMTDKSQFGKSIQYSFGAILLLYLPIAIGGYAVYGESVGSNVALSLSATPLTLVGNIFMAIHLVFAFIILINPVCQEMEEIYNIERDSVGWRVLIRLSIMGAILFIGESIPRFYTILALVGGTTVALLTYILPSFCYLSLINQTPREGQTPIETPGWVKLLCYEVIALGVLGAVAATYSGLSAVFSSAVTTPCYLR